MNMTFTLEVTLQGRLSDGEYVCASNCPMWDCCQNGLKMSEACPIRKWIKTQKVAGEPQSCKITPEVVTTKSIHKAPPSEGVNPWPARITNFLALHDMTQKDLGDLVGVHEVTISNWRRGQNVPRPETAQKKLLNLFKTFKREDNCETA